MVRMIRPEERKRAVLGARVPVGGGVEGFTSPVWGQHPRGATRETPRHVDDAVDTAGDGILRRVRDEGSAHGDEGGRTRRVDALGASA